MSLWRHLARGVHVLARRHADDQEVAEEIQDYFDQVMAAHLARGLTPAEAERATRLECGDPAAAREQVRSYGWENAVENMAGDLRYAGRQLRRNRVFTAASVLVLALGVGVGTAMFSVLDAVLLRPLPYAHADRLVDISEQGSTPPRHPGASGPDVLDWQRRSHSFSQIAYWFPQREGLALAHETDIIANFACSANLFATLGVVPRLGRGFVPDDQRQSAHVAVLSDWLWRDEFHADPRAIGQAVRLDGAEYTVIGVMPPGFSFPYGNTTLWTPYVPPAGGDKRDNADLQVIARLRPEVTLQQAQAELGGIQAGLARQYGNLHLPGRAAVRGYHAMLVAGVRPALLALTGAVGLVWLIACLSVAGLSLTRFAARRREFAIRAALGASRKRLAMQLLAEGLLLGGLASALGWALAYAGVAGLRTFLTTRLPLGMTVHLNSSVLLALLGLTLLSVLLVGMVPAWLAGLAPAAGGLRAGGTATGGRSQSRLRDGLVVAEIALALVLLAAAGLLLRTEYALRSIPLGFTIENVVTTTIQIPPGRFAQQSIRQFLDRPLLARLEALPGVRAAAITSVVPLDQGVTVHGHFGIVGRPGLPDAQEPQGDVRFTSPEYPATFGIALERGRFFDAKLDTPFSAPVAVVNHGLAARYFSGLDPIGQQLSIGKGKKATIIGVLDDVHDNAIETPPGPVIYFPTTQLDPGSPFYNIGAMFAEVAVRTYTPPDALVPTIRSALHQIAPDLATGEFTTMRQLAARSIGDQTFAAQILVLFAFVALAIALAGLYGLLAYAVAQRTREIGIRMALGAERRQIVALVLGRAGWLLGVGIGAGMLLALVCSRLLTAYLYGVDARDPWTLAAVAMLLGGAGLWAAYLPARQAARVSPVEALRQE